jgi:hypothetical protein
MLYDHENRIKEADVLREKIQIAQSGLVDRLTNLGQNMQDQVAETVENLAYAAIDKTKEVTREVFNVKAQTKKRPLTFVGVSVAAGFIVARAISSRRYSAPVNIRKATSNRPSFNKSLMFEILLPIGLSLVRNLSQPQKIADEPIK